MTFEFVKEKLTEGRIPCKLKEMEDGLIIELGMFYPDELSEKVWEILPGYKGSICAEESGGKVIQYDYICGGKKHY